MAWFGSPTTHTSSRSPRQASSSRKLQRVDVLELVDEHMTELPPLRRREVGVGLDAVGTEPQQVVEVDKAPIALLVFVFVVELGECVGGHRRTSVRGGGLTRVIGGSDHASLGPLDLAGDVDGLDPRPPTQQAPEQLSLSLEQLGGLDATVGPRPPELGIRDGVERARGDVVADAQGPQPVIELARGLASEREGHDVARIGRLGGAAVGDATV